MSKIKLSLPDFKDTCFDVIIWRRHWFRFQHTTEVSICFVILGNFEELFLRCYCFCCRCYWKNPGPWPTRPFRSVRFKILFYFYFTICKLISLRYKFLFKIFALHIKDSNNELKFVVNNNNLFFVHTPKLCGYTNDLPKICQSLAKKLHDFFSQELLKTNVVYSPWIFFKHILRPAARVGSAYLSSFSFPKRP